MRCDEKTAAREFPGSYQSKNFCLQKQIVYFMFFKVTDVLWDLAMFVTHFF